VDMNPVDPRVRVDVGAGGEKDAVGLLGVRPRHAEELPHGPRKGLPIDEQQGSHPFRGDPHHEVGSLVEPRPELSA